MTEPEQELNIRRLRFPEEMEQPFREHYTSRFVEGVRLAVVIILAAFLLVRLFLLFRGVLPTGSLFGTGVGAFALAGLLLCTYRQALWPYMQALTAFTAILIGAWLIPFWQPFLTPLPSARLSIVLQAVLLYLIVLLIFTYTLSRLRFTYAALVGAALTTFYAVFAFAALRFAISAPAPPQPPQFPLFPPARQRALAAAAPAPPILWQYALVVLTVNLMGLTASYWTERYTRRDYLLTRLLRAEQEKSERLLLNILPEPIAARLKSQDATVVDSFNEVSVLFADIVDFTPLSAHLAPEAVVGLLNDVFSTFDELAEKHRLEKIKTIGDAYMVVGGLPTPRPDHAEVIAEMALDMREAMAPFSRKMGQPLRIRIGINTGPVVAGVIGTKKFIYDLWGDTVNTASRMESHGTVGGIQVTEATYRRLRGKYRFEERGPIAIKGRGEMVTYLLHDREPLLSVLPAQEVPSGIANITANGSLEDPGNGPRSLS